MRHGDGMQLQFDATTLKTSHDASEPRALIIVMFSRLYSCIFHGIYTSLKSHEKVIK